jgi:hypothetical protein
MRRAAAALVAAAALLTGCSAQAAEDNKDPRQGRVWLDGEAACDWVACYGPWITCVGPDLVFYPSSSTDKGRIVLADAWDCEPETNR